MTAIAAPTKMAARTTRGRGQRRRSTVRMAGAAMTALSLIAVVHRVVEALRHPEAPLGISLVIALVAFFGSLQLFAIAVLGEYLIKVVEDVKRRPKFIRKAIRHGADHYTTAADVDAFVRSRTRSGDS